MCFARKLLLRRRRQAQKKSTKTKQNISNTTTATRYHNTSPRFLESHTNYIEVCAIVAKTKPTTLVSK